MSVSFATNATDVTGIAATYTKVTLTNAPSTEDGVNTIIAAGAFFSNLELDVTATSGTPTTATVYLTWDTGGDHFMTVASTITLVAGQTANKYGGAVALDGWKRVPSTWGAVAGTYYLWVKVDSGTVTVPAVGARLHAAPDFARGS